MNMKAAIVALTRGYPNNRLLYDKLIKRNISIFKNINKKRKVPADIILFHEGNISLEDQNHIQSLSPEEIIFVDVKKYFVNNNLELKGEERFPLGYRQMCRFHMFHIWNEVRDYSHILRVDEDIEIMNIDPYAFEYMEKNNISYMTGRFTKDIHRLTNKTLPYYLIENTNMNVKKIYNHKNPYTNLYATSVSFWLDESNYSILEKIALSDDQLINRWGDHTVHGIILNHNQEKIRLFPKLEYKHFSHSDLIIKNNFLRNLTINSKFNPVSIKEGFCTKVKIKIRSKFKSTNIFEFENH